MRSRVFLTILIILTAFSKVFACSYELYDVPPPTEIETQVGIGGNCYYKRIPAKMIGSVEQEPWRTEFYLSPESTTPVFELETWFTNSIFCATDFEGSQHIAYVERQFGSPPFVDVDGFDNESWLSFYVDGKIVASYSPIEIIKDKFNLEWVGTCGVSYLAEDYEFVIQSNTGKYIYRVKTFDERVIEFEPLTGAMLEATQSLQVTLMDAVKNNDLPRVKETLQQGVNPSLGNPTDGTPLHVAASLGYIDIVQALLEAGAKVDYRHQELDHNCDSKNDCYRISWEYNEENASDDNPMFHHPLYAAAENGRTDIIGLLLDYGADVNAPGSAGFFNGPNYALDAAVANEDIETVKYLLQANAKVSSFAVNIALEKDNEAMTSSLLTALSSQECALCTLAKSYKFESNKETENELTNILNAAEFLIANGADVNDNRLGKPPLIEVVRKNITYLTNRLINYGADVNGTDEDGCSVLAYGIVTGKSDLIATLLQAGADPNYIANDSQCYPSLFAGLGIRQAGGFSDTWRILAKYKANINILDSMNQENALQYATRQILERTDYPEFMDSYGDEATAFKIAIAILLVEGIDVHHKNSDGKTVFDLFNDYEISDDAKPYVEELKQLIRRFE